MKFLSYIAKGGKEMFRQLSFLFASLIVIQFVVFMFYSLAWEVHIPLTKFDVFMRNLISICTFLYIFSVAFVRLVLRKYSSLSRGLGYFLFYFIPLVVTLLRCSMSLEYNEQLFNQVASLLMVSMIGNLFLWCVFSIGYRVIVNQLFRELFTVEFQNRCEVDSDLDRFPFTISWIKQVKNFCIRHFRNSEILDFTPLNDRYILEEFSEESEVIKAYKQVPAEKNIYFNRIELRFKYTPVTFSFSGRLEHKRVGDLLK